MLRFVGSLNFVTFLLGRDVKVKRHHLQFNVQELKRMCTQTHFQTYT